MVVNEVEVIKFWGVGINLCWIVLYIVFWIVFFKWIRVSLNWFCNRFVIEWICLFFKWFILLSVFILNLILIKWFVVVNIFCGNKNVLFWGILRFSFWFIFCWLIFFNLYFCWKNFFCNFLYKDLENIGFLFI